MPFGRLSIGSNDSEDRKDESRYSLTSPRSAVEINFREVSIRYIAGTIDKDEV
jgi:hypothetical protein